MDDRNVVRAAQHGDQGAWQQLHQSYQPRLIVFFRYLVREPTPEIEDYCQLAWERVARSLHRFTGERSQGTDTLWPYLAACARNVYLNALRTQRRRVQYIQVSWEELPMGMEDDPANDIIRRVFAESLLQMLEEPRDREVLYLRACCDLTWQEAGDRLGIGEATVRWRYEHAIRELQIRLAVIAPPQRKKRGALILPPHVQREAVARYEAGGISRPVLAAQYGVSTPTMGQYIRKVRAAHAV